MSTKRKPPSYRLHKSSGQAIVTLSDGLGARYDVLLGKYGTAESRAEYARVVSEWETNGRRRPQPARKLPDSTVNELLDRFWSHVQEHYRRPDGTATSEVGEFKMALRPLRHLYGHTLARELGPIALKAVRQLMIDGYLHPEYGEQKKLARKVINQRIGRLVRCFAWGVENELIEPSVVHALREVRGLQKGRSKARETK